MSEETTEAKEITPEEARAVLEAQRRRRIKLCELEVKTILQRYGLDMVARPALTPDGRTVANIVFVEVNRPGQAS